MTQPFLAYFRQHAPLAAFLSRRSDVGRCQWLSLDEVCLGLGLSLGFRMLSVSDNESLGLAVFRNSQRRLSTVSLNKLECFSSSTRVIGFNSRTRRNFITSDTRLLASLFTRADTFICDLTMVDFSVAEFERQRQSRQIENRVHTRGSFKFRFFAIVLNLSCSVVSGVENIFC